MKKYSIKPVWLAIPAVLGIGAGIITNNLALGVAVFTVLLIPPFIRIYIPYAKDNPKDLWFKRKLYGWGWTPVSCEGWVVTFVYIGLVIAAALTIDKNSPTSEVVFTFILPVILLSIAFFRIAYKKGEKPRWQWGRDENEQV